MRLYSTSTSERASKSQGGNDYIEIELRAVDRVKPIGIVRLEYHENAHEHEQNVDAWTLTYTGRDGEKQILDHQWIRKI